MRIRYVVSTMLFWWREHHLSFEQECDYLKSLGFGIELWPTIRGNNDCRYIRRNWTRLRHATEGMLVTLNTRKDGPTLEEWLEQIECAQMLDHAPIIADLQSLCISDELGIADWEFAADVIAAAKQKQVPICVETGRLATLLQVAEKFDSIRFCIDTGFINIDPKTSFEKYVDELAPKTTYLHMTDNYGVLDDHEPPGLRGGIENEKWIYLKEALEKYDNDCIGSLEMFPSMPGTMIRKGCKFLFDFLQWPNAPKPDAETDWTSYRPM